MIPSLGNEYQAPASAVENLKIPIVGSKIKVVESIWCDLSKLVREGQKANEKRFSSIGLTSFEKKPKNYLKIPYSGKAAFSGSFGLFLLVSESKNSFSSMLIHCNQIKIHLGDIKKLSFVLLHHPLSLSSPPGPPQ